MKNIIENTELENTKEIVEGDIKSHTENKEAKLRLHLWTSEEHKESSLNIYALQSCFTCFKANPSTFLHLKQEEHWRVTLSHKIFILHKEISKLYTPTLAMRTPSLSCAEIPDFINNIIEKSKGAHNYICLDSDIYKHIDTHCKDLVKNGTIQVFVDGKLHDCNTDIAYIKR